MNTPEKNIDANTIDGQLTEVTTPSNALVTFDPTQYAQQAFEPFKTKFATAKRAASRAQFDIATPAGMKEAKALAKSFRDIRTGIENARKEAKGPILEAGKKVDAVAKSMTDEVTPHEEKFSKQVRDEEARQEAERQAKIAAERSRIEAIESRIAHIRNLSAQLAQADSATLAVKVEELATKRLDPAMYDEHLDDAVNALNTAVDELRALHQQALAREAEQRRIAAERAELERLRAEQAAREKADQEAAAERERQAQIEREAAAAREAAILAQQAEMKKQQAQMAAILEIQGLAAALETAGSTGDRDAVAYALDKARAFNPSEFGAMAPMAKMARDAVLPLLEDLMAGFQTADPVVVPIEEDHTGTIIGAALVSGGQPIEDDMRARLVVDRDKSGQATAVHLMQKPTESSVRTIIDPPPAYQQKALPEVPPAPDAPKSVKPADIEIVQAMVQWFGESRATVAHWILGMDRDQLMAWSARIDQ